MPLGVAAVLLLSALFGRYPVFVAEATSPQSVFRGGPDVEEIISYEEDGATFFQPRFFSASFVSPVLFAEQPGVVDTQETDGVFDDVGFANIQGTTLTGITSPLTTLSSANERHDIIIYIVQEGDIPSIIAASFGVSLNTLLWANSLKDNNYIRPGDALRIPPVSGVVHTVKNGETLGAIVKRYRGDVEKTIAFNGLPRDGTIGVGDTVVIPDGEVPPPPRPPRQVVSVVRYVANPVSAGYFIFPTTGRNWGRIHARNGVDIANTCGTPIYAAADGTITASDGTGWNGGFGKFVKILHPNGTETLYAHSSRLLVSAGDAVTQGQLIALIGTTGRSTGCHLHFEVHGARNPLARY